MILTPVQRTALLANIQITPVALALYTTGDLQGLADFYNAASNPAVIVWRTDVSRSQIYHQTSGEATTWNWTTYKGQNATEQNAWTQMFMGDVANFALPNLRAGVDAIFSGAGAAATQRAHVAAIAKRTATRLEALFAVGLHTVVSPSVMAVEGVAPYTIFIGL